MVRTSTLNGEELRNRILRMREAHIDWEAISLEIGIPVSDCQAIASGQADVSVQGAGPDASDRAHILVQRSISGRQGIVILVESLGLARTGKTTLAMELAALTAARGAQVALVDADVIGHGLFHATVPAEGDVRQGLLAWQPDAEAGNPERFGGWILPGSKRSRAQPVDIWAMLPETKREPEEAWSYGFWRWARASYSVVIVDAGESMATWASPARSFADMTLVVVPQDLIALARVSTPPASAGTGIVVMGYTHGLDRLLEPEKLAGMLGLPLLAAIPYDPRFANWQLINSVPWFPTQANANPALAGEMEKLVPEAFREKPDGEPQRRRLWRR